MVNGTLCPAGIVTGSDNPLIVNAELVILVAETVTLAPLADRLPDPVPVPPLTTLPMTSVEGEMLSCPATAVAGPGCSVPVEVGGWPLLVTVSVPLADPTPVRMKSDGERNALSCWNSHRQQTALLTVKGRVVRQLAAVTVTLA